MSILARAGYPPDSLASTLPLIDQAPGPAEASWAQQAQQVVGSWVGWRAGVPPAAEAVASAGRASCAEKRAAMQRRAGDAGAGDDGQPDTHPPMEERVARMRALAAGPEVQRLYHTHPWYTRLLRRWQ